jgi:acyl dehydratase
MTDLRTIQPGYRFPTATLHLDVQTIAAYAAAVEDPSPLYGGDAAVAPPLAVLALSMRGLTDLLARHPGTLHTTQRLTAHRAIPVGSTVQAHLTVASRSVRRGFAALTLEVRVDAQDGVSLDGATLLFVPLTGGDDA